jgi:hypothetical protein
MKFVILVILSVNAYIVCATTCRWTSKCYGIAYGEGYACYHSFPYGGYATGRGRDCLMGTQYECCGIKQVPTQECRWSSCVDTHVDGQATCNSFGADWKFSGTWTYSGCAAFFDKATVECCRFQNV